MGQVTCDVTCVFMAVYTSAQYACAFHVSATLGIHGSCLISIDSVQSKWPCTPGNCMLSRIIIESHDKGR
jgi:hypothetical protein